MAMRVNFLGLAALAAASAVFHTAPALSQTRPRSATAASSVAVAPQYDTTHVYVAPQDFDRFVASLVATFGGTTTKQGVFSVTPTPSQTMSQLVLTPAGSLSVFGFKTPIPYPFGSERTGYLVKDMDAAVSSARAAGADILVAPFPDPIGRDVIVQWPGGINMQLYWHTQAPSYPQLQTIPENRVYVSNEKAEDYIHSFLHFSHGRIISDDRRTPAIEVGRPGETIRTVKLESTFGRMLVLVTDGHLPFPYGHELTGYEVKDFAGTLDKAKVAGVTVLVAPYTSRGRQIALVQFPGGYVAEIHSVASL